MTQPADRSSEWFVPRFGPRRFRLSVGLLFLPYTGMVLSYAVIGSLLAAEIHWDHVGAVAVIYFLGLGIAAHALDALGSKAIKPWGNAFSRVQLWCWVAALPAVSSVRRNTAAFRKIQDKSHFADPSQGPESKDLPHRDRRWM